jgi:hypothetical protein
MNKYTLITLLFALIATDSHCVLWTNQQQQAWEKEIQNSKKQFHQMQDQIENAYLYIENVIGKTGYLTNISGYAEMVNSLIIKLRRSPTFEAFFKEINPKNYPNALRYDMSK